MQPRVSGVEGTLIEKDIAHRKKAVQRGMVDRALFLRRTASPPAVIMHLHVEGAGALGDCLPDLAKPQDAEPLAIEPPPDELHGLPAAPLLRLQQSFALGSAPRAAENEKHRDFRRRDRHGVRRVRDADAARLRRRKVDMLEAHRVGGDDAQGWRQPAYHLGGEFLRERDQRRVLALAAGHKLVRAHDGVGFVQVEIVIAARALDDGRTEHPRHEKSGLRHSDRLTFCALHRAGRGLWQGEFVLDASRPGGAFWRLRSRPSLETITTLFKLKDFI